MLRISRFMLLCMLYRNRHKQIYAPHIKYYFVFNYPVDGEWEGWGRWTECSVTCGGGMRSRERTCHNPKYGGKACDTDIEDGYQEETCNEHECPSKSSLLLSVGMSIYHSIDLLVCMYICMYACVCLCVCCCGYCCCCCCICCCC